MVEHEVKKRFWAKVEKTGGCWLWRGAKNPRGYGHFSFNGRVDYAHRVVWHLTYESLSEEFEKLVVMHNCDNPSCVRPDHLSLGTFLDNSRDAARKNRIPYGESHRHSKLTERDVVEIRARSARGEKSKNLAKEYGIQPGNICRIIRGQRWKRAGGPLTKINRSNLDKLELLPSDDA